jgi:preprotein translocase subunit SecG
MVHSPRGINQREPGVRGRQVCGVVLFQPTGRAGNDEGGAGAESVFPPARLTAGLRAILIVLAGLWLMWWLG